MELLWSLTSSSGSSILLRNCSAGWKASLDPSTGMLATQGVAGRTVMSLSQFSAVSNVACEAGVSASACLCRRVPASIYFTHSTTNTPRRTCGSEAAERSSESPSVRRRSLAGILADPWGRQCLPSPSRSVIFAGSNVFPHFAKEINRL